MKYLGETIDLHAGGVDLCFPHHENEIAQSEACTGKQFVRYWMHIAHLMVDGAKMSKSLGNMHTLGNIEKEGFGSDVLRYCLISGHYRQPLNFTMNGMNAAASALKKLAKYGEIFDEFSEPELPQCPESWTLLGEAYGALLDDLNVPLCLGEIFKFFGNFDAEELNSEQRAALAGEFFALKYALGLRLERGEVSVPDDVQELADARWTAKSQGDFALADELRVQIEAAGWLVKDSKSGFTVVRK
jgi:cysteinyl-tRNA synthetase